MADKFQDKIRGNLRDAAKTGKLKEFKKNVVMDTRTGRILPDNKSVKKKYGGSNIRDLPGSYSKGGRAGYKDGGGCMQIKGFGKARKPKKKSYA